MSRYDRIQKMDPWVLWLIAAVILAIGEIATTGFFLAPFAGGALVASLLAALDAGATIEFAAFLVVSVILLALLRPLARQMRRTRTVTTGTAKLVGQTAMVIERIANAEGIGCVKLDGEIWTARAYDDDEVIEPGTRVHVLEIRGATALVSE
jgi:membrane protein implicated in regulation of membrane protease activity